MKLTNLSSENHNRQQDTMRAPATRAAAGKIATSALLAIAAFALAGGCRKAAREGAPAAAPQAAAEEASPTLTLLPGGDRIAPGADFTVGVDLTVPAGWHTYWRSSGDSGLPPAFDWKLPEGVTVKEILYPVPQRIVDEDIVSYGFDDGVRLLAVMEAAADLPPGGISIGLDLNWMVCKEMCLPERSSAALELTVGGAGESFSEDTVTVAWRRRLPRPTEDWRVETAIKDGRLELRIEPAVEEDSPAYRDWEKLKVFAEKQGGLDPAQDTEWRREGPAWVTSLRLGDNPYTAEETFSAVLATGEKGDWTGWRISR